MSHFSTVATSLVSQQHLVAALNDLGLSPVETHETPVPLRGWQGHSAAAHVIVRRENLPWRNAFGDLGFVRNRTGTFDLMVDETDRGRMGQGWVGALQQRYAYHVARDMLGQQDFSLVEESRDRDGTIRLTLRRMG